MSKKTEEIKEVTTLGDAGPCSRRLPPSITDLHSRRFDDEMVAGAASLGYDGMFDDGGYAYARRRLQMPARMRGGGLRSRAWLARIAYCACFIEVATWPA